MAFSFILNGREVYVGDVAPQATLLDFIRARGLTGAKEGCAEGECGACAVRSSSTSEGRQRLSRRQQLPDVSAQAAGREFYTVESLAERGELSDVQQAMAAAGGSQCGYCTPGFRHEPVRRAVSARPSRAMRSAGDGRQPVSLHRVSGPFATRRRP